MKKVLALLFASTLILGACGDKNDESKNDSSSNSTDSVSVDKNDNEDKTTAKFKNDKLTTDNFDIEILEAKTVKASEYDDDKKPSIAIIYGVKNKKDKDLTASSAFIESFDIYQNSKDVKRKLEIGGGFDTDLKEKYEEDMDNQINKDGKVKGVMFFKLKDTKTPVTLEAKDPNHSNNEKVGTKEFKIKEK